MAAALTRDAETSPADRTLIALDHGPGSEETQWNTHIWAVPACGIEDRFGYHELR